MCIEMHAHYYHCWVDSCDQLECIVLLAQQTWRVGPEHLNSEVYYFVRTYSYISSMGRAMVD
jgi:hypothetical protein